MTADHPLPATGLNCIVFGAAGGLGSAFVAALAQRRDVAVVHAVARSEAPLAAGKIVAHRADITSEAQIAQLAARIGAPLHCVVVASGILHRGPGLQPEKDWRQIEPAAFAEVLAVNTIGPALVFKHFAPLLSRGERSIMVALSARVGSISDNRLGGWYSYRASKAALNQIIRTFSVELARKRPLAVIAGLHPGTVETGLSNPFGGGPANRLTPQQSADALLQVMDGLTPAQSGRVFDWKGDEVSA